MNTVYKIGDYKVVVISATYGIVGKDGRVLYRSPTIEDAIQTAEDIQDCGELAA